MKSFKTKIVTTETISFTDTHFLREQHTSTIFVGSFDTNQTKCYIIFNELPLNSLKKFQSVIVTTETDSFKKAVICEKAHKYDICGIFRYHSKEMTLYLYNI